MVNENLIRLLNDLKEKLRKKYKISYKENSQEIIIANKGRWFGSGSSCMIINLEDSEVKYLNRTSSSDTVSITFFDIFSTINNFQYS